MSKFEAPDEASIARFFNDITPEQFQRKTSAWKISPAPQEDFEQFATNMASLTANRFQRHRNPRITLQTKTERRTFRPDPAETVGQFLNRAKREAREMGALWVHVGMISAGTVQPADVPPPQFDHTSGDSIRASLARGELTMSLVSYCEARELMRTDATMWSLENDRLGEPTKADSIRSPALKAILDF